MSYIQLVQSKMWRVSNKVEKISWSCIGEKLAAFNAIINAKKSIVFYIDSTKVISKEETFDFLFASVSFLRSDMGNHPIPRV